MGKCLLLNRKIELVCHTHVDNGSRTKIGLVYMCRLEPVNLRLDLSLRCGSQFLSSKFPLHLEGWIQACYVCDRFYNTRTELEDDLLSTEREKGGDSNPESVCN